jgi:adenosylhomocysteine nucleosidase
VTLLDDPCVLFALARESSVFRRRLRQRQRFYGETTGAGLYAGLGRDVLVLEAGIGPARMEAALAGLFGKRPLRHAGYQPQFVVSAGFSGALREGISVGDVILSTELVDEAGGCWPATWPPKDFAWDGARGRLLTVSRLVSTPAEKQALGLKYAALAADMESAIAARICSRHGVPFGCVRAISDDAQTALSPRLVGLLSGGRVSPLRVLVALAASPRLTVELWRLARHTRLAATRLADALTHLLDGQAIATRE